MEFFSETKRYTGVFNEESADNFSFTLTGNLEIGNLIIKPEIRLDNASDPIFVANEATNTKRLASFIFATIYEF